MSRISGQKEWYVKISLYKDVVDSLEKIFSQFKIYCMPINGAYYCYTTILEKNPPSQSFEIEYFFQEHEYERAVDIVDDLENCRIMFSSHDKTVFFYILGTNSIRVTFFYLIRPPGGKVLFANSMFFRGEKIDNPFIIFPSNEDALFLLMCETFQNIGLFFDKALFFKVNLLISQKKISLKKFWSFASEYGIDRFACYILSLYSIQRKVDLYLPQKNFYSSLLLIIRLHEVYPLLPKILNKILFKVPFVHKPITYFFTKCWQNTIKKCINTFSHCYSTIMKKLAKQVIIKNENKVYQNLYNSILINAKEYSVSGSNHERLFISTSNGLWLLNNNRIQQLTIGVSYGITRIGNRWYLHQNMGEYSRIISFRIDLTEHKPKMRDIKIELTGLPLYIHQIDSHNEKLYITDTLKNRIICINKHYKRTFIYPNNKIKANSPFKVNNHFNSIYITDDLIHILAHNGQYKPEQNSQIFVVSRLKYKCVTIIEIDAQKAHNIILFKNKWMYCDSLGGALKWGNSNLFTDKEYFLRGLAMTKDTIFVGGSQIIERDKRLSSDSTLWFLDHEGGVKRSLRMEKIGQICEIRSIDFDYGLSESWKK